MTSPNIILLGIGNILFSDEGFGVRVIERLNDRYTFSDNVTLIDGGVLGLNLLGVMSEADHLIVIDTIKNKGESGTIYRLEGDAIPARIRAKNSIHQIDFLEALTLCQALDKIPETVIIGVEPKDIETLSLELTPATRDQIDRVIEMILKEVERLGASYKITDRTKTDKGNSFHVPCDTFQNYENRK